MKKLIFGCIADDFTGGSDAASFIAAGGMNTILCSGIPEPDFILPEGTDAVVIALKSRTQETSAAVADSLAAIRWLQAQGAEHFYVKYCSTFDSTPKGNIGPILDAVIEHLDSKFSVLCPALPANGRVVKDGILYVKGVPLAESPMKDHPLTPMWASRITELMAPQSRYEAMELHSDLIRGSREQVQQAMDAFCRERSRCYFVPDYETDEDAARIASLFGDWKVLSGGSGILTALAQKLLPAGKSAATASGTSGSAVILAGSCSTATHAQTEYLLSHGGKAVRLEDEALLSGEATAEKIWEAAKALDTDAPLVYAYDTPEGLQAKRCDNGRELAAIIENTISKIAVLSIRDGVTRIIVAGGETSGAVTKALGYSAFRIGQSIAPGVPILIPVDQPSIRLVLKSGNFGQEDFFFRALEMTHI